MMTSLFALPHQLEPATVIRIGGLFNAENLAIAAGRIFVTGSKGVYEAIIDDTGPRLSEIPVNVGIPSDDWLRNGIASDGRRLYLACAHVHRSLAPLFRGLFDNPPDIEQTLLGLGKLLATESSSELIRMSLLLT